MKKMIYLLLLMMLPQAFATMQTFPTIISVSIYNDTVNITTEQDTHVYNCYNNTMITAYTLSLQRNVSDCLSVTDTIEKLTSNLGGLTTTCDTITKQYGDVNTYFKLYTSCNVENEICKKGSSEKDDKIKEFETAKKNLETCNADYQLLLTNMQKVNNDVLPAMQTNLTTLSSQLRETEKDKFLWGIIGAAFVAGAWAYDRKKQNPMTRRGKMGGINHG